MLVMKNVWSTDGGSTMLTIC